MSAESVPTLVVVSGPPGAGKTTLARGIGRRLRLPVFSKDDLKESLYDSLGGDDIDSSRRIGRASIELLFNMMEVHLCGGQGLIAEMNFHARYDPPKFKRLGERCPHKLVQVHCSASDEVIVSRYRTRGASGARHPAHFDSDNVQRLKFGLADGIYGPLEIHGRLISVDTSKFEDVKVADVVAEIEAFS